MFTLLILFCWFTLQAEEWKNRGNAALKEEKYNEAVECYTKAIECDPTNHILYSNRSAAYIKLKDGEAALKDAEKAIELAPTWSRVRGKSIFFFFFTKRWTHLLLSFYRDGAERELLYSCWSATKMLLMLTRRA